MTYYGPGANRVMTHRDGGGSYDIGGGGGGGKPSGRLFHVSVEIDLPSPDAPGWQAEWDYTNTLRETALERWPSVRDGGAGSDGTVRDFCLEVDDVPGLPFGLIEMFVGSGRTADRIRVVVTTPTED